jgi:hypothetical protein
MMKQFIYGIVILSGLAALGTLNSCKKNNPSSAKIFVRSADNVLVSDARVVLIADIQSNESDQEFVDTLFTNGDGYVEFNILDYFEKAGKEIEVANFDVIARKNDKIGSGEIRTRVYTTAVETVFLGE